MKWITERIALLRIHMAESTTVTGRLYYRGRLDELALIKRQMKRGTNG